MPLVLQEGIFIKGATYLQRFGWRRFLSGGEGKCDEANIQVKQAGQRLL